MLHKTRGLVLNYIKYKETSVIVKIFTEQFGLQSYLVNSVRSAKSKNKIALFQPLTFLDMVVYKNDKKDIQRLSEFRGIVPFKTIPYDHNKSASALFLAEILHKSLSTEEGQTQLFEFLLKSFSSFDLDETPNRHNFHLIFLYQLTYHFGLSATAKEMMRQIETWLPYTIEERELCEFCLSNIENFEDKEDLKISNQERKLVLNAILTFLQQNFSSLNHLKSLDIIKTLYL
jgi:DNA repair protein RecO (recombination protein O)